MTDIHGNPDFTDVYGHSLPRYIHVPVHPAIDRPRDDLPFPHLGPDVMTAAVFLLYALFASLYALGLLAGFPRAGWHDTAVAAGVLPSLIAGACWPSVRLIPYVGPALYVLPGLALATLPFALDLYLMFGR